MTSAWQEAWYYIQLYSPFVFESAIRSHSLNTRYLLKSSHINIYIYMYVCIKKKRRKKIQLKLSEQKQWPEYPLLKVDQHLYSDVKFIVEGEYFIQDPSNDMGCPEEATKETEFWLVSLLDDFFFHQKRGTDTLITHMSSLILLYHFSYSQ